MGRRRWQTTTAGAEPHRRKRAISGSLAILGSPRKTRSAQHSDYREPRLRTALAEREVLQIRANLEPVRPDLFHGPTDRKGFPDLPLGDSPGALGAGLLVAEAEQEEPTALPGHMGQPGDVASPILIGEDVEQPAVDHAVEPAVERRER